MYVCVCYVFLSCVAVVTSFFLCRREATLLHALAMVEATAWLSAQQLVGLLAPVSRALRDWLYGVRWARPVTVHLRGSWLSDQKAHETSLPKLDFTHLSVVSSRIRDHAVAFLAGLAKLRSLHLSRCNAITDGGVARLVWLLCRP